MRMTFGCENFYEKTLKVSKLPNFLVQSKFFGTAQTQSYQGLNRFVHQKIFFLSIVAKECCTQNI